MGVNVLFCVVYGSKMLGRCGNDHFVNSHRLFVSDRGYTVHPEASFMEYTVFRLGV